MRVAYPFALRAARRSFKNLPERKKDDAQNEFMAKTWDHCKSLRNVRWETPFCYCPLKHTDQTSHRRIDKRAAKSFINERLTHCLELPDTELGGRRLAI